LRKLHNEELHTSNSLPNNVRMIKSMRMRWAGHVAGIRRNGIQGFAGKARRDQYEDLHITGR
jgi:hypothetical protein